MFKMLNYKMENLVLEEKQVVVVLSFPRKTSDLGPVYWFCLNGLTKHFSLK